MRRFTKAEEDERVHTQILKAGNNRVRTGHGKPEKSWNFKKFIFQAWKVMEFY